MAAPELLDLFTGKGKDNVAEKVIQIANKVTGAKDPENAAAIIGQDPALMLQFQQSLMANQVDLQTLQLGREELYVNDVKDARKYRDYNSFYIALGIYSIFLVTIIVTLLGCYWVLNKGESVNITLITAVFTFLGTILGYVAAQAQMVSQFYFGSSYGSISKGDEMADAIKFFKFKKD